MEIAQFAVQAYHDGETSFIESGVMQPDCECGADIVLCPDVPM